jgi:hypothetical protein
VTRRGWCVLSWLECARESLVVHSCRATIEPLDQTENSHRVQLPRRVHASTSSNHQHSHNHPQPSTSTSINQQATVTGGCFHISQPPLLPSAGASKLARKGNHRLQAGGRAQHTLDVIWTTSITTSGQDWREQPQLAPLVIESVAGQCAAFLKNTLFKLLTRCVTTW